MKRIGTAENGNVLLECSMREYEVFVSLVETIRDKKIPVYPVDMRYIDGDLSNAFRAIVEWIMIKDRANQLRYLAREIDSSIGEKVDGQ